MAIYKGGTEPRQHFVCGSSSPSRPTSIPVLSPPPVAGFPLVTTYVFPLLSPSASPPAACPPPSSPVADVAATAATAAAAGVVSGLSQV